jgi:predicted Zn-dependent protease
MLKKLFFTLFILSLFLKNSFAGMGLIRDAQTERFLYDLSRPIFKAASAEDSIKIHIIADNNINAFVAQGRNIFLNTGTITFSDSPLGLAGVIAHEAGHITGSHLAKMSTEIQNIQSQLALGYILGIATAFTGNIDAGQAIILGNMQIGERRFFKFSKSHEEAADEAALKYLDRSNITSQGLADFFGEIRSSEKLYSDKINPYTRTHPLTANRITRIENSIKHSKSKKYKNYDSKILNEFPIVKGKLIGFIEDVNHVRNNYTSNSDHDKMARAIAMHRLGKTHKAIRMLKSLKYKSPYITELIGQLYLENGEPKKSYKYLSIAHKKLSHEPLVKIELAAAILSMNDKRYFNQAIKLLKRSLIKEKNNSQIWTILSSIYSKQGKKGLSKLSLAENFLLIGKYSKSIKYAKQAKKILKKTNPQKHLRADDIILIAKKRKKDYN